METKNIFRLLKNKQSNKLLNYKAKIAEWKKVNQMQLLFTISRNHQQSKLKKQPLGTIYGKNFPYY